jgi:predicted HicB family RNase H-like nuclease
METIKLGVFLTPEEHKEVKIAAAMAGKRSMTEWVAELIREKLKRKSKK